MGFQQAFENDVRQFADRFQLFEQPQVKEQIVSILSQLDINYNVKKAILSIDTAMRLADSIDDDNKETQVLATDLLSALFYKYMAEQYMTDTFYQLTNAVKDQNVWKTKVTPGDRAMIERIETAFVAPFLKRHQCQKEREELVQQSIFNK